MLPQVMTTATVVVHHGQAIHQATTLAQAPSTESTMNNNPFGNSGSKSGAGKQGDGSSAPQIKIKTVRSQKPQNPTTKKRMVKAKMARTLKALVMQVNLNQPKANQARMIKQKH